MDSYNFPGPDWFSYCIPIWTEMFRKTGAPRSILEVGAYEGRSTVWMAENLLAGGGELIVIDHWRGGAEHDAKDMPNVEARFDANVELLRKRAPAVRVVKIKSPSSDGLARLLVEGRRGTFDFVYVDASHEAPDVLTDAVLTYPLLRTGGLIAFDDYAWRQYADVNDNPKAAIDTFSNVFWKKLVLVSAGYQAIFRKLG